MSRIRTFIGYSALATVAGLSFALPSGLLPQTALAASAPEPNEVTLNGVIRDFRMSHVDFDVTPSLGYGHVADNVLLDMDNEDRPVFNSGGDENGPFDARIAHWKFDDGAGAIARDEKDENPGNLQGGASWTNDGRVGGAIHFDGVNDIVEIPSSPEMQITGDITFSGWFKLDTDFDSGSPKTMVIMEKFLSTEADFHVALAGGDYNRGEVPKGTLVFKVENGPTSDYYCYTWSSRRNWQADTWYHFAASLTSGDTGENILFVNGSDDTDGRAVGVGFIDASFDAPMRIGGKTIDYNGHAENIFFKGTVDDVMIFDRALTGDDFAVSAAGFEVTTQWEDSSGNYIAPHLYTSSTATTSDVYVVSAPVIKNSPTIDSFDSTLGAYGGANVGATPNWVTGSAMSVITVPSGLPWQDVASFSGNSTSNLSADIHCNDFMLENQHTLHIHGDVTIVADNLFEIENNTDLVLQPHATLTVYSNNETRFENSTNFNANTADPARVKVYHLGTSPVQIQNSSLVHAWLYSPFAPLVLSNGGEFFGRFEGMHLDIQNSGAFHHDSAPVEYYDACGNLLNDVAGAAGSRSSGDISSGDTFVEWFRDYLGTNLSAVHSITLVENGGVYEYLDDEFYPIDEDLFGNEGMAHNYFFTYSIGGAFTYEECDDQFIEFYGGDGAWIFINGELVIDLGGMASATDQVIELDRLELTDGESYTFDIFYSNRSSGASVFRLRTNLDLDAESVASVTAGFD